MAGPLMTMVLADNGAEVIKVESRHGDWARSEPAFQMWNRGKKSVVLDLRSTADRESVRLLAARCDVVVESFRPGVAEKLGVDYSQLNHERLVYCSISGFGDVAQLEHVKAYDGIVSAKTDLWTGLDLIQGAVVGGDESRPIFKVACVNSYAASQLAFEATVAALLARRRTGVGQHVSTSLLQGAGSVLMRMNFDKESALGSRDSRDLRPKRWLDPVHRGICLTFLTAECKDGRWIQMCARQDHHFRSWVDVLGLGQLLDEPRYAGAPLGIPTIADIENLEWQLRAAMRSRTQGEWMEAFVERDIGADPFLDPREFLASPDMVLNDRVVELPDAQGGRRRRQPGPIALLHDTPSVIVNRAPTLGEHTLEVMSGNSDTLESAWQRDCDDGPLDSTDVATPLSGVTVLELAYFLAAPLAGSVLAELGARVIKVEPLGGDSFRRVGTQAAPMLHGKESIALDLQSESGRAILSQLIEMSDVFYTSFRPQVHEKLGCDYATVSSINPNIVYLFCASYGSNGPSAHRPAFHSTPNAVCGAGVLQSGVGNPPVDDSWPDPVSGLGAATAILLGLAGRETTGTGQYVETTMLCSTAYAFSKDLMAFEASGEWASTLDPAQLGRSALERLYPCEEGWLLVQALQQSDWVALARALGRPEWETDPRFASSAARAANDQTLHELLHEIFEQRSATKWEAALIEAGVPAVRADGSEFLSFMERHGLLYETEHPAIGPYYRLGPRFSFSAMETRQGPACSIGEHTRPLLEELGFAPGEIDALATRGLIGTAEVTVS